MSGKFLDYPPEQLHGLAKPLFVEGGVIYQQHVLKLRPRRKGAVGEKAEPEPESLRPAAQHGVRELCAHAH